MQHKQTEPPPLFTEATLVKKLEEEGIGRPSTYAEIISKVQARDYVNKLDGKLVPSELGKLVIDRLVRDGFDLADISFTRKLEEDLDAVAQARAKRLDVLAPFHERLQKQIAKSLEEKGKWWPEPEDLGEACPTCGKALMKRWGRNGPFIGCVGYPDCDYTRNIPGVGDEDGGNRTPEMTDWTCDKCGSRMMKRWGRNGWFLGCSAYPKCKSTRPVPIGVKCPKCKVGEIIEVRMRGRGRTFFGCTNYQSDVKCDFRSWLRPVAKQCPECKAPFVVRAGGKTNPMLKCQTQGCNFEEMIDETLEGDDGDERSSAQG
jgi:DNA topoisomerase-1